MRVSFPLLIQAATIPLAAATLRICQDKGLSGQCLDNETALGICVTGWSRWSGDRGSSFKIDENITCRFFSKDNCQEPAKANPGNGLVGTDGSRATNFLYGTQDEWPYDWFYVAATCWNQDELVVMRDGKDGPIKDKNMQVAVCPPTDEGCVSGLENG